MKGEFSRLTFDSRRHMAATLWQQGRVGVDADWNEWVEQVLHRLKTETIDVIGECGRPIHNAGFGITVTAGSPPALWISPGRLYAGGLMAELEDVTDFANQIDWPLPAQSDWNTWVANNWITGAAANGAQPANAWPGLDLSGLGSGSQADLVYAEVWLRHVTSLNDEAERAQAGLTNWNARPLVGDFIRERALGGPDTCTRLQTVAQVKLRQNIAETDCASACDALAAARPPGTTGLMQVLVTPTPPVVDPCEEPITGGYGGTENRTYRVEVHRPGPDGAATFKWSNENGAFTLRVKPDTLPGPIPNHNDISLLGIGNDLITQLKKDDWVEMCGEETELGVFRNALCQVVAAPAEQPDGTWKIQLTGDVVIPHAPFVRRWSGDTQTITLGTPFPLDAGSGLAVQFFPPASGSNFFHDLDYWIWAARVGSRAVEPLDIAQTPQSVRGIERHYCCLALVTWTGTAGTSFISGVVTDCPNTFPPLTELPTGCCCTVSVGDGTTSHGEYTDIAAAVAALPAEGGIVCILPGHYPLSTAVAIDKDNVIIHGCGRDHVQIEAAAGVFTINSHSRIAIQGLGMLTSGFSTAEAINATATNNLMIVENRITLLEGAPVTGISIQGNDMAVLRNEILGQEEAVGGLQVRGESNRVKIKENRIEGGTGCGISLGGLAGEDLASDLTEIEIEENTIRGMGSSGISSVTKFSGGVALDEIPLVGVPIEGLRIANNIIQDCCWGDVDEGDLGDLAQVAPRPVIFLGDVQHAQILCNRVEDNNRSHSASGIFIILGQGLRIHSNRIMRNAGPETEPSTGIAIFLAILPLDADDDLPPAGAWPAASICGNLVEAQKAPALGMFALGPLTVLDNRLVTEGLPSLIPTAGATVSILNLGLSEEYATIAGFGSYTVGTSSIWGGETNPLVRALELACGDTLFSRNQCLLKVESPEDSANTSVFVGTLDDLGAEGNQLRCQDLSSPVMNSAYFKIDGFFFGATVRVCHNRFSETMSLNRAVASCIAIGFLATGIGNQATHCMYFMGLVAKAAALNLIDPFVPANRENCKEQIHGEG